MTKAKSLGEGGPKQRNPALPDSKDDPELRNDERQAVRNQSVVSPEQYPAEDRAVDAPGPQQD